MTRIRRVEMKTCTRCGREFDRYRMDEIFTGRSTLYICPECKVKHENAADGYIINRKSQKHAIECERRELADK